MTTRSLLTEGRERCRLPEPGDGLLRKARAEYEGKTTELRSLCCKLARNCQLLDWHRAHMHLNADQFDALSAVVTLVPRV